MPDTQITDYFSTLCELSRRFVVTDAAGDELTADTACGWLLDKARGAHAGGDKLIFIGNGGSAAIASHMAIDYAKNGGMRATAFNDPSFLTCLGNDLGFENVFAKPIDMLGAAGDMLIAISSSGNSPNILNGVAAARAKGMTVVTLSGFAADNKLRRLGDLNVYVPSPLYGLVEVSHLAFLHAVLDIAMGWRRE